MGDVFTAALLKRVITPGLETEYRHIARLSEDLQAIVFKVIGAPVEGRAARLQAELLAIDKATLWSAIQQANPAMDLDALGQTGGGWELTPFSKALEPRPPREWAVRGIFPATGLVAPFGAPKTLKSLCMKHTALAIAAGKKCYPLPDGSGGYATRQTPVVWMDGENGSDLMAERLAAFAKGMSLPKELPFWYVTMPPLDLTDPASIGDLALTIRQRGAEVAVLDHLAAFFGGVDINSPLAGPGMRNLRRVVEECNCLIILLHHRVKLTGKFGSRQEKNELSGNHILLANLETAILIEREDRNPQILLKDVASRLSNFDPLTLTFAFEQDPETLALTSANFFTDPQGGTSKRVREAILVTVRNSPGITQSKLRAAVADMVGGDMSDGSIRAQIAAMERDKTVTTKSGKQNSLLYFLGVGESGGERNSDEQED